MNPMKPVNINFFQYIKTGRREIPENEKDHHKKPHNVPFVALGTALLWFGWFGFNPGGSLLMFFFSDFFKGA